MQVLMEARRRHEQGAESTAARVIGEPLLMGAGDQTGVRLKSSMQSYCLVTSLAFWPRFLLFSYLSEISLSVVFIFQVEQTEFYRGSIINFKSKSFLLLGSVPGHPQTVYPILYCFHLCPQMVLCFILMPGDHAFTLGGHCRWLLPALLHVVPSHI